MPATATAQPRPDPAHGRVPVEWIGRARLLRDKVGQAHQRWSEAAARLVVPLTPRCGFVPTFDRHLLPLTAARWRALPEWGRLRPVASTISGDKLSIAELRIVPFRLAMAGWQEDELAVALAIFAVAMQRPSAFQIETKLVATLGLHALARRYSRGRDGRDHAVVRDMLPIVTAAPGVLRADRREFEIAAGDGRWIGAVMDCNGKPCLVVRTFVA